MKNICVLLVLSLTLVGCGVVEVDETEEVLESYTNNIWVDSYEDLYIKEHINDEKLIVYSKSKEYTDLVNLNTTLDEIFLEVVKSYDKPINNKVFNKEELNKVFESRNNLIKKDIAIYNSILNILKEKEELLLYNLTIESDDKLLEFKKEYSLLSTGYKKYINTINRSKLLEEKSISNYIVENDRILLKDIRESELGSMGLSNIIEEIVNLNRVEIIKQYSNDLKVYKERLSTVDFNSDEIKDVLSNNLELTTQAIEKTDLYIDLLNKENYKEAKKIAEEIKNIK